MIGNNRKRCRNSPIFSLEDNAMFEEEGHVGVLPSHRLFIMAQFHKTRRSIILFVGSD